MFSLNAGGGARLSDKDPAPLFRSGFGHRENVGFGSLADIGVEISDVRFNPESRHSPVQVGCPLSANSGAWPFWLPLFWLLGGVLGGPRQRKRYNMTTYAVLFEIIMRSPRGLSGLQAPQYGGSNHTVTFRVRPATAPPRRDEP